MGKPPVTPDNAPPRPPILGTPVRTAINSSGTAASADIPPGNYVLRADVAVTFGLNASGVTTPPGSYKADGYHWVLGGEQFPFEVTEPRRPVFITEASTSGYAFIWEEK